MGVRRARRTADDGPGAVPEHAARFLRDAGPVPWDESRLVAAHVDEPACRILHVVSGLEADTEITTRHARTLGIDRADDVSAFLDVWAAEEAEHAHALGALLAHQTYRAPEPAPASIERRRRLVALLPRQVLGRLPQTGLLYCALGAAAEYVTIAVYDELSGLVDDPAVDDLLRSISRQERRHCAFFLSAARARARAMSSVNGRLTRRVLVEMWDPPGVPSLGLAAWRDAFAPFLADAELRARVLEMDRVVDSIPHLEGLDLMLNFLRDHAPLDARRGVSVSV
jgi:rubrerythrin